MAKKLYYKIGEACKILGIQPYVLRYWETEFPFLSPNKSKSGQRVYSEHELDIIRRIKELLYEEGYTIAGAKKKLEAELEAEPDDRGESAESERQSAGTKKDRTAAKKKTESEAEEAPEKPAAAKPEKASASGGSKKSPTPKPEPRQPEVGALDTQVAEKIEKLRSGVEGALDQARAILELLG